MKSIIVVISHAIIIQLANMTIKWTDVNSKVLIDVLVNFSGGRFSNLFNKKEKWVSIVESFNSKSGMILIDLKASLSLDQLNNSELILDSLKGWNLQRRC